MNILGYHVYSTVRFWLSEDEKTWTSKFYDAASFNSYDLAKDIGEREKIDDRETIYVFAIL